MTKWPEPESDEPCDEDVMMEMEEACCTTSCEEICVVEPDGVCTHGHPSWPLRWGWI